MAGIEMNYEDVKGIFKENLKIESLVKSIQSIFLNPRFTQKINYKPYFQRNYVWDDEKATYFIESILLGTEIPPLVFFQTKNLNEIIDGRQRYETIQRFINDKLLLKDEGLHKLKILSGKRFSMFDEKTKEIFESTKLRILQCSVVNEPKLDDEKEDKIKKEIFRRYNSGITPLLKEEIARAEYIDDIFTKKLRIELETNKRLMNTLTLLFLPKRKKGAVQRDKINIILSKVRTLITLPYIPIYSYAHGNSKGDIIKKYYYSLVIYENVDKLINRLIEASDLLRELNKAVNEFFLKDNSLIYECSFWAIYIGLALEINFSKEDMIKLADLFNQNEHKKLLKYWKDVTEENVDLHIIFESTGSHYYKAINNRYIFISNYFNKLYKIDYAKYLKDNDKFKIVMETNVETQIIENYKINKTDPVSITIFDIMQEIEKSRFLIRPSYQRSEVVNQQKASYLLESMLLGIKIPPLFIFKRSDGIKEVIDGQQRILTLIGFLGKTYLNEEGNKEISKKDRFKLSKLRILDNLNGSNIENLGEKYEDKLWDFPLDIVEIDGIQNPDFSAIDLFLRLNTKPYPIKDNTFEMWNAYIDKEIILKIRELADKYEGKVFRPKDTRMKIEELITSLAYLEYKFIKDKNKPDSLLGIYIRNGKLSGRIKRKENVTKTLSEISENQDVIFLSAIDSVEKFVEKINYLVSFEYSNLGGLFGTKNRIQSKTDQNFYFLWIILHEVSLEDIMKKSGSYFDILRSEFIRIQNLNENLDVSSVIKEMESLLK